VRPLALLAVVVLVGCPRVDLERCAVRCSLGGPCPDGYTCASDGYCHGAGDDVSCSASLPDAGPRHGGQLRVRALAVGPEHACAIDVDGRVWCWGRNHRGQVGSGSASPSEPYARRVRGLDNRVWRQVVVGDAFSCVRDNREVYCWGDDTHQQLGAADALPGDLAAEAQLTFSSPAWQDLRLAAGQTHACLTAAPSDGDNTTTIFCWGYDLFGQCSGRADFAADVDVSVPTINPGIDPSTRLQLIVAGNSFTCAGAFGGIAPYYCWGENDRGQYGNGMTDTSPTGVQLVYETQCVGYAAGPASTACYDGLELRVFGGLAGTAALDVAVSTSFDPGKIAVGGANACYISDLDILMCYGHHEGGVLGTIGEDRALAQAVEIFPNAGVVGVGDLYACGALEVSSSSAVACWGTSMYGRLGNGQADGEVIWPPSSVHMDARDDGF
jgi:alpha-tubulin suppressor-like RCC1 family protein